MISDILPNFKGTIFTTADNWKDYIPLVYEPIRYLEIGSFCGGSLISAEKTYGAHPESKLYCIDPWEDYEEYPEYKGEIQTVYELFQHNIKEHISDLSKVEVLRGYTHEQIHKIQDASLDIVYIDGNHEPEYVLEDAVLCFRKLKKGGYMIFDDYGWGGSDLTAKGIDAFLSGYFKRIKILAKDINEQVFIEKL